MREAARHHGGAAFYLPVSISRLSDDIEAHAITTELEKPLHNWMFFRLRPSSRIAHLTSFDHLVGAAEQRQRQYDAPGC
jgi:hypothetical protein